MQMLKNLARKILKDELEQAALALQQELLQQVSELSEDLYQLHREFKHVSEQAEELDRELDYTKSLNSDLTQKVAAPTDDIQEASYEMDAQYREIELLLDVLKLKVHAAVAEETRLRESRPKQKKSRLIRVCGVCQQELPAGALRTHLGKWRCEEHKVA